MTMQDVIDATDVAAKSYPLKALASEIGKAESTLRNELTQQEGYKLGLGTWYQILKTTQDFKPLDIFNTLLGRVSFEIPTIAISTDMPSLMQMTGDMVREFGQQMSNLGAAIADGKVDKREAGQCFRDLNTMIKHAAVLRAYLETLL